jgi:DNA invertase Pin-like site-specific DNA recombinase
MATRRLIRHVLGAVSEFEKRVIVLKLRAARERKRARGERVEGVKPYFPAEQAIVERMKQLRRKAPKGRRLSVAGIAAQLNSEGHRNRAGRDWSPQMVHHVLLNGRVDR